MDDARPCMYIYLGNLCLKDQCVFPLSVGEETVRSLKKLRVFKALGNLNRPEGTAGAITAHSQWLGGAAAEADYRKGFLSCE